MMSASIYHHALFAAKLTRPQQTLKKGKEKKSVLLPSVIYVTEPYVHKVRYTAQRTVGVGELFTPLSLPPKCVTQPSLILFCVSSYTTATQRYAESLFGRERRLWGRGWRSERVQELLTGLA
jgi:hypothetical protein